MDLKLILPNRAVSVAARVEAGRLTITGDGIWFQLEGLTLDHILHGDEPGVIREEREPRDFISGLTMLDLDPALPVAELKAMLIEHFVSIGLTDIAEAIMMDYKALTGKGYASAADKVPNTQLTQDLALVESMRDELVQEGELVWGAQSRIAEVLGVVNGGSHRTRILAVAEALLEPVQSEVEEREAA